MHVPSLSYIILFVNYIFSYTGTSLIQATGHLFPSFTLISNKEYIFFFEKHQQRFSKIRDYEQRLFILGPDDS